MTITSFVSLVYVLHVVIEYQIDIEILVDIVCVYWAWLSQVASTLADNGVARAQMLGAFFVYADPVCGYVRTVRRVTGVANEGILALV